MNFQDFKNPELQEKLKNASSPEELLKLANEAGFWSRQALQAC